jgi:hypothetical protein
MTDLERLIDDLHREGELTTTVRNELLDAIGEANVADRSGDGQSEGKWERAMKRMEDVRAMLEEIVEEGAETAGGHEIVIDASHGLAGLDRAEEALHGWQEAGEREE